MSPAELQSGTERAWRQTYGYRSILRRLSRARTRLPLVIPANLGYRYYACNLSRFHACPGALP
jgi:hypothetical protein